MLVTHTFTAFKLRKVWNAPPSPFYAAQECHWVNLPFFYKKKNLLELLACKCHIDRHTSVKFKVKLCFYLTIYVFIVFRLADHVADFWIAVNFLHLIA